MASEESLDETIVDWKFNFGDGTIVTKSGKVEHTYTESGEYTVELGVLNDKGEESKDTAVVTVTVPVTAEPTPTPTITPTPKPTMNETTTVKVVYEGLTPIKDSLASPSKTSSDAVILKTATESVMSKVSYPYNVTKAETQTTFKIVKYRCDGKPVAAGLQRV
jgi:PKD repeat protein